MARYVLLRVADDSEADDLLGDVVLHPYAPLLSPGMQAPVHVELVSAVDPSDVFGDDRASAELRRLREALTDSYERGHRLALEWEGAR